MGGVGGPALRVEYAFVELATPLVLHKEVALEDGLDHEVVFVIARLEQVFLHDGQLGLIDADETTLGFRNGHFLANL